jgi:Fur family iron response transcriptional regulator
MPADSEILRQSVVSPRGTSAMAGEPANQPDGPTDRRSSMNQSAATPRGRRFQLLRNDFLTSGMGTRLREIGLRRTRARVALGSLLFANGARHVTAEMLFAEARQAGVPVSLATVYNTLHQFTQSGLLRQVTVDSSKSYFDTNNSPHHHFYVEGRNELIDIPSADLVMVRTPVPPSGYEISSIDVVVRVRGS